MIVVSGFSQSDKFWSANFASRSNITKDKAVSRTTYPSEFKLFNLNFTPFKQVVLSAVQSRNSKSSTIISLPNADGNIEQFEIFEASNLYAISVLTLTEVLPHAVAKGVAKKAQAGFAANLHQVVDVSQEIAVAAAHIRASTGLRTPDAIISATASTIKATLWTCDAALAKAHKGARLIV